jgi:hypothetical protein
MGSNQGNLMEPQGVLPVPYALPQSDPWGRMLKILGLFSGIFGAIQASFGGLMIYLSFVRLNIGFPGPPQMVMGFGLIKLAGGAAATIGGIMLMRRGGRALLTIGVIILLGAELAQSGQDVWNAFHAGSAIGQGWWALASLTMLYVLITSVFPVMALVILWQSKKRA